MSQTVISVENLSKAYRLGQIGTGTLSHDLNVWWAKARGKPNPLLKIGQADYGNRDGETIWALKDVSFTVAQGEVLGIIGRNGAGKSTLLKILSRVTAPTSGKVKVKGRIASLLEVGTGFHPDLTGRENVYLNGAILGMSRKEIDHKFDEIVDFAEIEKFIDTPVKRYSSGMYVRLAFAVAAHLEPEILLVDEVLTVGDVEFQKKSLGKMGEAAKGGRTIIFISHNMAAIEALCEKCILLKSGQIIYERTASECVQQYLSGIHVSSNDDIPIEERKRDSNQTLRAKITDITVITKNGPNQNVLSSSEPFTIRLTVLASSDLRTSVFFHIWDQYQLLVWGDSGSLQNKLYNLKKGTYTIDCNVFAPNLASGNYIIACGLSIPFQESIDYIKDAYHFSISEFDPYGSGYDLSQRFTKFHINHQWAEPFRVG